ncbi:uncharacterized protein LOC116852384 [Odontomachus brunneus]|uniref:uncharacterized protein LOC116852384 n=1 Tax=Odontomachus brunneus TaxID=486640 RepID=UPI0013F28287|nr:uncharacterized protein LOC116852384 [Odontomachus brunneus]XP_032688560.1 uncharacterized protein LOC116852384 [Odontomachus brunneus]
MKWICSEMARFFVVEFEDELHLVPCIRLLGKSECFWPPYENYKLINKAVSECREIDTEKWKIVKTVRIFATANTYESGMAKVKLAEKLSDIDSSVNENNKQNRQNRAKKNIHSDDEYEDLRCMLLPPPKKPTTLSMNKPSEYSLKSPNREHSRLSNKTSYEQKENCNRTDLSSSSLFHAKQEVTSRDTINESAREVLKKPIATIDSRMLNVNNCNSTILEDMELKRELYVSAIKWIQS